jgi:ribosome-associated protein
MPGPAKGPIGSPPAPRRTLLPQPPRVNEPISRALTTPYPTSRPDGPPLNEVILDSISDKKGVDVVTLDLRHIPEAVADTFILCNGTSTTQVRAIAEHVDKNVREKAGEHPWHMEGTANGEWVLIDYVDTVVHVFLPEKRSLYNLEELWADAELTRHDDDA